MPHPAEQAVHVPTAPLDLFRGLSPNEVKHRLAQGTLLTSLQNRFMEDRRGYLLTGIRIFEKEKYRRDASFLSLLLDFKSPVDGVSLQRELILRFPLSPNETTRFWYYPEDPDLPALAKMVPCQTFLQEAAWEKPWENIFPRNGEISIKRLQYNPGRRASFLLSSPEVEQRLVLKVVQRGDFGEFLGKTEAIQQSSLSNQIMLPRLISYSSRENLFLYEYIPSQRIDYLDPARLQEEVARLLQILHQTAIPSLPQWNPMKEMDRMQSFMRHLERHDPQVSSVIGPLFGKLSECFVQNARSFTEMIHNSFSAKHILYIDRPSGAAVMGKIALIDWDSSVLGPREKDIALFLSGFPEGEWASFLDLYQKKTHCMINLDLMNSFVQYRRFLECCRKLLGNRAAKETSLSTIREIARQLDRNPLKR